MPLIIQPSTNLQSVFDNIQGRLQALETMQPPAMARLASKYRAYDDLPSGGNGYAFTTTFTDMADSTQASFTLSRPAVVYVNTSIVFFTTAGTANFGYVKLLIRNASDPANAGGFTDLAGVLTEAPAYSITTNGGGVSNGSPYMVARIGAGSYVALMQYKLNAGVTTSFTNRASMLDVWRMGG